MVKISNTKDEQDLLDFIELSAYNNATMLKAMTEAFPKPVSVVKSKLSGPTASAIADYENDLSKPFFYKGKTYNLKPGVNISELPESVDYPNLKTEAQLNAEKGVLTEDAIRRLTDAKNQNSELNKILEEKITMLNKYFQLKTITPQNQRELDIKNELRLRDNINDEIEDLMTSDTLTRAKAFKRIDEQYKPVRIQLNDDLQRQQLENAKIDQDIRENDLKKEEVIKAHGDELRENAEKIKKFQSSISLSSSGLFNPEQNEGESNEHYLERMKTEIEEARVAPEEVLIAQSELYISKKLKDKLSEVIKNISDIELVMSNIPELEIRQDIIKNWENIKDRLIKLNMVNNKLFKPQEYVEYFEAYNNRDVYGLKNIDKSIKDFGRDIKRDILSLGPGGVRVVHAPEQIIHGSLQYDIHIIDDHMDPVSKILEIKESDNSMASVDQYIYFKVSRIPLKKGTYGEQLFISNTNVDGEWNTATLTELKKTQPFISGILTKHIQTLKDNPRTLLKENLKIIKRGKQPYVIGAGIAKSPIPKIVEFGDVFILLKKLYTENILTIKNKHNKFINGFRDLLVSDIFIDIIFKLIKGGTSDNDMNKLFKKLSSDEQIAIGDLMYLAKIHKTHGEGLTKDIDDIRIDLKKKFIILEGELTAGNDNPKIKKDLFHLVHKMRQYNMISPNELNKYIIQLK